MSGFLHGLARPCTGCTCAHVLRYGRSAYAGRMGLLGRRAALILWLLALVTSSCTSGGSEFGRGLSSAELDCAAAIDAIAAPPENYQVIRGAVALPDSSVRHELGRTDPESGMRFAKMGLLVRPGETSSITVSPDHDDAEILIGWGITAVGEPPSPPPVERLVVPRCESDSAWVVYAGGVWVSEPACVGLTVSSGDRDELIRLPIATDCP